MLRTILVVVILLGGVFALSSYFIGYDRAGNYYIGQQKKKRKSIRVGSPYYNRHYGSRGFRAGK
jgi:hypothetical protein